MFELGIRCGKTYASIYYYILSRLEKCDEPLLAYKGNEGDRDSFVRKVREIVNAIDGVEMVDTPVGVYLRKTEGEKK